MQRSEIAGKRRRSINRQKSFVSRTEPIGLFAIYLLIEVLFAKGALIFLDALRGASDMLFSLAIMDVIKIIGVLVVVGGLGLYFVIENHLKSKTRNEGVSLVGWIVQANNDLFRPGSQNLPAQLLISFDVPDGNGLQRLAGRMARLKSESPTNEAERIVAAEVRDERTRLGRRFQLPPAFAGSITVYAVDVMIERKLLPERYLTERCVVCQAIPGDEGPVYMKHFA